MNIDVLMNAMNQLEDYLSKYEPQQFMTPQKD